jgi:cbb3-type cytochrome oxidase subunit 3
MSTYEYLRGMVGWTGLLYFGGLFIVAVCYALRPSKKGAFDEASRLPLSED